MPKKLFVIIKRYLKSPRKLIVKLGAKNLFNWIPDRPYLKLAFWGEMGKGINMDNPKTFNEKLQCLKIYDRKAEYTRYVDKYEVRSYIKETVGEEHLIPLLGVYNSVDEIDFNKLPNQFVLKCSHGSQCNIICTNKDKLDLKDAKRKLTRWMKKSWFWFGREWPYKNVKPRIICEKYMIDESGTGLVDYKFMCFNGEPDNVMVCIDRSSGNPKFYFFDEEWNLLRYNIAGINAPENFTVKKPDKVKEMFEMARILSRGLPFVRVDLYNVHGKIYFGELTFYPQSGFDPNLLKETDLLFGNKIDLKEIMKRPSN